MAWRNKLLITAAAAAMVVVVTAWPDSTPLTWDLNVDYFKWSDDNGPVKAGEGLEFTYDPNEHNVVMVDEDSYIECSVPSNASTWTTGRDIVVLPEPGEYYFICGMGDHCNLGMKLNIRAI